MLSLNHIFWPLFTLNIVAIAGALVYQYFTGMNAFEEGGFLTYVSATQLLILFRIAYLIARQREKAITFESGRNNHVWTIISFGFFFLAADELFEIHEQLDLFIHDVFDLEVTGLSDRLDDAIVAIYGLIGIVFLLKNRDEISFCIKNRSPFIWGFVLFGIMVLLDVLTNRLDILLHLLDRNSALELVTVLFYTEDSLKLMAEVCFIEGFYLALIESRRLA